MRTYMENTSGCQALPAFPAIVSNEGGSFTTPSSGHRRLRRNGVALCAGPNDVDFCGKGADSPSGRSGFLSLEKDHSC